MTSQVVAVVPRSRLTTPNRRCGLEHPTPLTARQMGVIRPLATAAPIRPERTLIVGWNRRAPKIVQALDAAVAPGSELTILTRENQSAKHAAFITTNQRVSVSACASFAAHFAKLDVLSYTQAILLPDLEAADARREDALTVDALLALRRETRGLGSGPRVLAELIDPRKADLIEMAGDEEIVVGRRLTSLLLARLAEDDRLAAVCNALLVGEGNITLRPVADYVAIGAKVAFGVVAAAWQRGEIAIGYKLARFSELQRQIHINPRKSSVLVYQSADQILVITPM